VKALINFSFVCPLHLIKDHPVHKLFSVFFFSEPVDRRYDGINVKRDV